MKFIQDSPGLNHHTDDARIYFRGSATEAPTHLRCVGMGYTLSAESHREFDVELAPFAVIGVGRFGEGRPCDGLSSSKWTGNLGAGRTDDGGAICFRLKIQLVCVGKTRAAKDVCFVFRAPAFAGRS
jgi:hypothetical protein